MKKITTLAELNQYRKEIFNADSEFGKLQNKLKNAPNNEKAKIGKKLGELKTQITEFISQKQYEIEKNDLERSLKNEYIDATQWQNSFSLSGVHPIETLMNYMANIFKKMGWQIQTGPEIESEWFNFDALNFCKDHPARQMQDTFYIKSKNKLVLRTHTSPAQSRFMLKQSVPIAIAIFGKVFRSDELDQTHTPVFHQVEGLVVDKNITMAHLKGSMDYLASTIFGDDITTRLRPSFFPFTEPSAEMDILCFVCKGKDTKCKTCGGTGWIEWGGCGQVHPNVLKYAKVDYKKYQGFAFGIGIERTLMFLNNVKNMHNIVDGDIRFTNQFGISE